MSQSSKSWPKACSAPIQDEAWFESSGNIFRTISGSQLPTTGFVQPGGSPGHAWDSMKFCEVYKIDEMSKQCEIIWSCVWKQPLQKLNTQAWKVFCNGWRDKLTSPRKQWFLCLKKLVSLSSGKQAWRGASISDCLDIVRTEADFVAEILRFRSHPFEPRQMSLETEKGTQADRSVSLLFVARVVAEKQPQRPFGMKHWSTAGKYVLFLRLERKELHVLNILLPVNRAAPFLFLPFFRLFETSISWKNNEIYH